MSKRGNRKFFKLLPLFVTIAMLFSMIPSFPAAAETLVDKPVVKSYSVSPASVVGRSNFGMDITFQHYIQTDSTGFDVKVVLSSGSNITIKPSNATFNTYASAESTEATYKNFEYNIYIPEDILEYKGSGTAKLTFKITYEGMGDKYQNMEVTKTIPECVKKESTSSDNDDSGDEPIEPIGNVFVVPQDAQMPQIQAGTTGEIKIPIKCSLQFGGVGSTQITVGTLPDGLSFASPGATYQMIFNNSEPQLLSLNITADKDMKGGVYAVPLKVSYKYDNTVNVSVKTEDITAYIRVLEADGSQEGAGKLLIDSYKLNRSLVKEGQSFQLAVTLANRSDSACNNVTVSLDGLATEGITTDGMLNTQTIPTIKAGESQTVTFKLRAHEKMSTGSYEISINVAADGDDAASSGASASSQSTSAKIFIPIEGSKAEEGDTSTASKPQIIIESYDYGGMSVVGGQEFTLKMTFRNTSRDTAIENMKMTVGNPASESDTDVAAFTPAKSSNTFFIERIGPGETFSREIALYPKADASPKSYGVRISYKYEAVLNNTRQELSDEETISIPLTQPDRFEVSDVVLYGPIYMGDSASLSISYVNMGKSSVYNLSVKLEGENFTSSDMDTYIGNVESGSSDSFDTSLTPDAPGTITGKALFSYEGPDGSTKTVEKEFSCEVMEMPVYDDPGMDTPIEPIPEETGGLPGWAKWAIGGGCVVLVIAAIIVIRKIRAKRQAALDLEDNEEE